MVGKGQYLTKILKLWCTWFKFRAWSDIYLKNKYLIPGESRKRHHESDVFVLVKIILHWNFWTIGLKCQNYDLLKIVLKLNFSKVIWTSSREIKEDRREDQPWALLKSFDLP